MNKKGFTLIEMLVIVAIIVILAAIVLSAFKKADAATCGGWFQEKCTTTDKVVASVPVPQLTSSSERVNVAERAKRFDIPDKISYVYLVSYGKVMAFYTAKGKISSLNSYLTPTDRAYGNSSAGYTTVSEPDIDGTYGENVEGIFFFTTEGAYVEWKGDYMMSDQPLKLSTPPALVREIK